MYYHMEAKALARLIKRRY